MVEDDFAFLPKVAPQERAGAGQSWALLRNPVGIFQKRKGGETGVTLTERESVKNGPELFFVLGLRKRKNVVLAKSAAVHGEAESEATQILIEFCGLLFRNRYQCFITIRHERASQALHGVGYSKVLTKMMI